MLLGALLLVTVLLLTGTALLQRRTRRRITGQAGLDARAALCGDDRRDVGTAREVGRQEIRHTIHHGNF